MEHFQVNNLPEEESEQRLSHPRAARARRIPRFFGEIGRKLTPALGGVNFSVKELFYQTTVSERVVVVASILAIAYTFFPWVTIRNITITGWNNFLYSLAILIVLSSIFCIWTVIWNALGKDLPRFIGKSSTVHIILGIEIMQLGLIIFTLLTAYGTNFEVLATEDITSMPILIIFTGIAILGAGLFEQQDHKKSRAHTILVPHLHEEADVEEPHDLEKILQRKEQESTQDHTHHSSY